jgi:lambda repressor-like predicted transcriptional regulator
MNAMNALLRNVNTQDGISESDIENLTSLSYKIADAMEIKRKQKYPSRYRRNEYERGDGKSKPEETTETD